MMMVGNDPRCLDERSGTTTPAVQRADPFTDVGPGRVQPRDERHTELGGEADRPFHRLCAGFTDRAVVLAAFDAQLDDRSTVHVHDARRDAVAPVVHDRRQRAGAACDHAMRNHATG